MKTFLTSSIEKGKEYRRLKNWPAPSNHRSTIGIILFFLFWRRETRKYSSWWGYRTSNSKRSKYCLRWYSSTKTCEYWWWGKTSIYDSSEVWGEVCSTVFLNRSFRNIKRERGGAVDAEWWLIWRGWHVLAHNQTYLFCKFILIWGFWCWGRVEENLLFLLDCNCAVSRFVQQESGSISVRIFCFVKALWSSMLANVISFKYV